MASNLPADPPTRKVLASEALRAHSFAPFGDVIDIEPKLPGRLINQGQALRYDGLATLDTTRESGRPRLSIFRAQPRKLPLKLSLMERHLRGSQTFVPLQGQGFLVVVAAATLARPSEGLRCFLAAPGQGVNLAAGVWHHPLLALTAGGDFLVIDREGPESDGDCDEHPLVDGEFWVEAAADA